LNRPFILLFVLNSLFPSFEQRHESRLLEVLVSGQSFRDALTLHDDKRDAIGQ
jgi:hypothetical protein